MVINKILALCPACTDMQNRNGEDIMYNVLHIISGVKKHLTRGLQTDYMLRLSQMIIHVIMIYL